MSFAIGDRVVVTDKYRGAGCNHDMIGHYGHVVAPDHEGVTTMVYVSIKGRIDGKPMQWRSGFAEFPFYEFELDHAD